MKRIISYILVASVACVLLASCSSQERMSTQKDIETNKTEAEETGPDSNEIAVKGLVLKYVLVDTAYELYQVNALKDSPFSRDAYSRMGDDTKNHYEWLRDTYNSMDADNKARLKDLFESGIHVWKFMDLTTRLDDSAGIDDIVQRLASSREVRGSEQLKAAITEFLPYFYSNYLKGYIEKNSVYDEYAEKLNKQVRERNADIAGFMERTSGIRFITKFKPVFYYTLRPIGAMSFDYGGRKISTIQRTCTDYTYLLGAPFHEFSHELFKTFTDESDFLKVAELLKSNTAFRNVWDNSMKNSYDWAGWCEENLVEGFAKYLDYKYYGRDGQNPIYIFDGDFFNYLKERNFDGQKDSLKETSIEFYKSKLQQ